MDILNCKVLNETIKSFEIKGLRVYVLEKSDFCNISASFVVKYGSNDICFKENSSDDFKTYPLGIAHFLEHKMFDGKGNDDIFKNFSSLGADVNAYTSANITNYYFNTISNFEECLKLLCDMIYNLNLTVESVESEKLIIEQEIKMYDDDPYSRVYRNFLMSMYNEHPVKNDIAGDVETIKIITKEDLEASYNSFYVNNNMFLVIVGNVEVDNVKALLEKFIVDKNKFNVVLKEFNGFDDLKQNEFKEEMDMSIPTNILGFKYMTKPDNYLKNLVIFEFINKMYFRATSDFYNDMYKNGIIDNSYYVEYSNELEYGHYIISCDGKEFEKLPDLLLDYYENYDFYKDKQVFDRVKKSIYGNYISAFNSIENVSHIIIKFIRHNISPFDYLEVLKSVNLDDVIFGFKNIFKKSNMVFSQIY